jgi:hypothetical protein
LSVVESMLMEMREWKGHFEIKNENVVKEAL